METAIMPTKIEQDEDLQNRFRQVKLMLSGCANLQIKNDKDYQDCVDKLKEAKRLCVALKTSQDILTRPINDAKKAAMDRFRPNLDNLKAVEQILKRCISDYNQKQEELRRKAERVLQEKAIREEEKQRKRLEERAKKAEEKGNSEKAESLREESEQVYIQPPTIQDQTPNVEGVSSQKRWYAEVFDVGKVPREYLIANQNMMDKVAKATKGTLRIPGVEMKFKEIVVVRT